MRLPLLLAIGLSCLLTSGRTAAAQDFRVYTVVRDIAAADRPIITRSLTLFRARRAYDWVEDLGEVVVSDRTTGCVCVMDRQLHGVRMQSDEVRHFLKLGQRQVAESLDAVPSIEMRTAMAFTLRPQFLVTFDQEVEQLTLTGGGWTYRIDTTPVPDPAYLDAYLAAADRATETNFLLHPRATAPAFRRAVNDELRRLGRLPLSVTLEGQLGGHLKLQADHKFEWSLQSFDRSQIRRWDSLIDTDTDAVDWMTLDDFRSLAAKR